MIRSFRNRRTRDLFEHRKDRRLPAGLVRRVCIKLDLIDDATSLGDLAFPAGNRLHALHSDREGQFAIAVNLQWRICFRWRDGDAFEVELCDYH